MLCIYDKRLDRMTTYQSEATFDLERCVRIMDENELKCEHGEINMGLRRYIGLDLKKAL